MAEETNSINGEMTKVQILTMLKKEFGIELNPGLNREDLLAALNKAIEVRRQGETAPTGNIMPPQMVAVLSNVPPQQEEKPSDNTQRILDAIAGVASGLQTLEQRVNRIETGGVNDYKREAKSEDIESARASKEGVDPRLVKIIEETLGIDFGVEVKPNDGHPGFELTVLVPHRLSSVKMSTRPVMDKETGKYKIDPETQQVVEEDYWPGDRRSMQLGTASSFEMVRDRCNRIRSYIISEYTKMSKPIPEFKLQ